MDVDEDSTGESVIVAPGEDVSNRILGHGNKKYILGPGLNRVADSIVVCNSGIFKRKGQNTFWVDSHRKRYIPARGELVIGIVTSKAGDYFKVDIGSSEQASLSYLAFEGATKKNRPRVEIGDLVYAKLLEANRDMEPELVCITSTGKKDVMSVLPNDGFMFSCSLNLTRKLLRKEYDLLFSKLGKIVPYEIAVGLNGRIWIKSKTVKRTIALSNIILTAELLRFDQIEALCNDLIQRHHLL